MVELKNSLNDYAERDLVKAKRALISVSDKTGLIDFAQGLHELGVEIISTGSTAQAIKDSGIPVKEVSEVTGFKEALDGRVKTLHPGIHGGILADLRLKDHQNQLQELSIEPFELIAVNLYPFEETVASGKADLEVIENIDIGGPAMVRAAAKNHANVAIVVNHTRYAEIIAALADGGTTLKLRKELATEAFVHTAQYDSVVANWFLEREENDWHESPTLKESEETADDELLFDGDSGLLAYEVFGIREKVLRYGENSHQRAALFTEHEESGLAQAVQLQGKEMSYNNFVDADAAARAAYDHERPAVAIIKHANPCGVAVAPEDAADGIATAHLLANECDPVSAFGGVVAANRTVTEKMALNLAEIFTEVLIAPDFEPEALKVLSAKKNLRVLRLPEEFTARNLEVRQISGGFLVQESDRSFASAKDWKLVAGQAANDETLKELEFAWRTSRAVKSNGIVLTNGGATVGVGMGQVNRVDSCRLAVSRAGERAHKSVAASDAFFPFADGLEVLLEAGVRAVVQPGGSVRDEEVIAACEARGVTMYFTGERHFFH